MLIRACLYTVLTGELGALAAPAPPEMLGRINKSLVMAQTDGLVIEEYQGFRGKAALKSQHHV